MKKFLLPIALALTLSACGSTGSNGQPSSSAGTDSTTESLEVLTERANSGESDAEFQLGAVYHDGKIVKQDFEQAISWFEKSAKQNDTRAQFNLGVMYYTGEGVKQDFTKARAYFEAAAQQKNARAQFNLGVMYYRGEGVKQDYAQAISYFGEAGAQGFAEAEFNLGVMYAKGEGVTQDIAKAYAWFTVAESYGSDKAKPAIDNIENALSPQQLTQVKKQASELKSEIDKNVEAIKKAEGVL